MVGIEKLEIDGDEANHGDKHAQQEIPHHLQLLAQQQFEQRVLAAEPKQSLEFIRD